VPRVTKDDVSATYVSALEGQQSLNFSESFHYGVNLQPQPFQRVHTEHLSPSQVAMPEDFDPFYSGKERNVEPDMVNMILGCN